MLFEIKRSLIAEILKNNPASSKNPLRTKGREDEFRNFLQTLIQSKSEKLNPNEILGLFGKLAVELFLDENAHNENFYALLENLVVKIFPHPDAIKIFREFKALNSESDWDPVFLEQAIVECSPLKPLNKSTALQKAKPLASPFLPLLHHKNKNFIREGYPLPLPIIALDNLFENASALHEIARKLVQQETLNIKEAETLGTLNKKEQQSLIEAYKRLHPVISKLSPTAAGLKKLEAKHSPLLCTNGPVSKGLYTMLDRRSIVAVLCTSKQPNSIFGEFAERQTDIINKMKASLTVLMAEFVGDEKPLSARMGESKKTTPTLSTPSSRRIALACHVWFNNVGQAEHLDEKQFCKAMLKVFKDAQENGFNNFNAVKAEHLQKLFKFYTEHQTEKLMTLQQFCHAIFFLNARKETKYPPMPGMIEAIEKFLQESATTNKLPKLVRNVPLFISPPQAKEILQKSEPGSYVISLDKNFQDLSYLTISTLGKDGSLIQDTLLKSVNGKPNFASGKSWSLTLNADYVETFANQLREKSSKAPNPSKTPTAALRI